MDTDYDLLSSLYHESGFTGSGRKSQYSTTTHHEITTSTVSMLRTHYCVHCGSPAKNVQKRIGEGFHSDYRSVGYRCNCEGAINEAAALVAQKKLPFEIELPKSVRKSIRDISEQKIRFILQQAKRIELRDFQSSSNGKITKGEVQSGFFSEDNKRTMTDNYYNFTPLYHFGQLVAVYSEEMISKYKTTFEEDMAHAQSWLGKLQGSNRNGF